MRGERINVRAHFLLFLSVSALGSLQFIRAPARAHRSPPSWAFLDSHPFPTQLLKDKNSFEICPEVKFSSIALLSIEKKRQHYSKKINRNYNRKRAGGCRPTKPAAS